MFIRPYKKLYQLTELFDIEKIDISMYRVDEKIVKQLEDVIYSYFGEMFYTVEGIRQLVSNLTNSSKSEENKTILQTLTDFLNGKCFISKKPSINKTQFFFIVSDHIFCLNFFYDSYSGEIPEFEGQKLIDISFGTTNDFIQVDYQRIEDFSSNKKSLSNLFGIIHFFIKNYFASYVKLYRFGVEKEIYEHTLLTDSEKLRRYLYLFVASSLNEEYYENYHYDNFFNSVQDNYLEVKSQDKNDYIWNYIKQSILAYCSGNIKTLVSSLLDLVLTEEDLPRVVDKEKENWFFQKNLGKILKLYKSIPKQKLEDFSDSLSTLVHEKDFGFFKTVSRNFLRVRLYRIILIKFGITEPLIEDQNFYFLIK